MLFDSYEYAEEDLKARQLAEARVEADRIVAAARRGAGRRRRLLSPEDARGDRSGARRPGDGARGDDHQAIRAAIEALDVATKPFAERRMNEAFDRGLRGKDVAAVEGRPSSHAQERSGGHEGHSH